MRIIIDAMGGDNAPVSTVLGTIKAREELPEDVSLTLVGKKDIIEKTAADAGKSLEGIEIVHTDVVIEMEDPSTVAVRSKSNSSMSVGLKMLSENEYGDTGDAFISAGSTGALHLGSSILVGRLEGVKRSCISALLPFPSPVLLLDAGANTQVTPDYLCHWAVTGSVYMRSVMGINSPRIGLLNNGAEETKGTELYLKAHRMLAELRDREGLNFVGNIEAREIPFGACDVLVCDGFTGNVALKLTEGMGKFMMKTLKSVFTAGIFSKLSYLCVRSELKKFRKSIDTSENGGAPLLGLKKIVLKAHGSSDEKVIYNTIKQAVLCVENDIIGMMERELSSVIN